MIIPIGVEQMGDLAGSLRNPDVLRLEKLDTDLRPPASALAFTKAAVDDDAAKRVAAAVRRSAGATKRR